MILKSILITLSLFTYAMTNASQTELQNRVNGIEQKQQESLQELNSLHARQDFLDQRLSSVYNSVDVSNDFISNQLEASNRYLTVVSIVLSILGVILGVYVTIMERKMSKMVSSISESEEKLKKLESDIKDNIKNVFQRVRKADTEALLIRLEHVPGDIANVVRLLLVRDMDKNDFQSLKNAYKSLKMKNLQDEICDYDDNTYGDLYLLLFFRHFLRMSIMDVELREAMVSFFDKGIEASFENELFDVFKEIASLLKDYGSDIDRQRLLTDFRLSLSQSKFSKDQDVARQLKEDIQDDHLWSLSTDSIEKYKNESKDNNNG